MFSRKPVMQDRDIARFMRAFFNDLTPSQRSDPKEVAMAYGRHVWVRSADSFELMHRERRAKRSRFYVGLSVHNYDLEDLTKRATLVSDTLLLSHQTDEPYRSILNGQILTPENVLLSKESRRNTGDRVYLDTSIYTPISSSRNTPANRKYQLIPDNLGMHCPDLSTLGRWILRTEPLATVGLAWYLPEYVRPQRSAEWPAHMPGEILSEHWYPRKDDHRGALIRKNPVNAHLIDYLVEDGRIVDGFGAEPIKSKLVRPIMHIDLPFINGVGLAEFSRILTGEFDHYRRFRHAMRDRLLAIEDALDNTQSERALVRIAGEIENHILSMQGEMKRIRRKRALQATGAGLGSVAAILVAVYGPAFREAVEVVGATGGLWGFISALADNGSQQLRENEWYLAWVLSQHAGTL